MYFDDLSVGFGFETASREISLDDILDHAKKWDPQPFHIDPDAAAQSPYGGIIASGLHTVLVAFSLTLEANIWNEASLGSPGMQDIKWLKPVYPGNKIRVVAELTESKASASRPDRGFATFRYDVFNQSDEMVAQYSITHLLYRRP